VKAIMQVAHVVNMNLRIGPIALND
jgi:hypothetical protein